MSNYRVIDFTGLDLDALKALIKSQIRIDENGCWIWTGPLHERKYGSIMLRPYEQHRINRVSLKLFKPDEFVPGCDALHKCQSDFCIHPDHLYWGTNSDNMKDAVRDGTHRQTRKTHCPQGHPYSGSNLFIDKSKRRRCRTCSRQKSNKYWHRKR